MDSNTLSQAAAETRLLVLDVDGVLTDGRLYYDGNGGETKSFHVRDGYGLKALQRTGIQIAVISGRRSKAVETRMAELDIELVFLGIQDKLKVFRSLVKKLGITVKNTACVGDDVPDLEILREAGLSVAVADAHPEVIANTDWQTENKGGHGAVREVCDLLIAARARQEGLSS